MQEDFSAVLFVPVSRNQPENSYENEPTQIRPSCFPVVQPKVNIERTEFHFNRIIRALVALLLA